VKIKHDLPVLFLQLPDFLGESCIKGRSFYEMEDGRLITSSHSGCHYLWLYNISEAETGFEANSTPFQPRFNPIAAPFQPHFNPILTPGFEANTISSCMIINDYHIK